jgi:hypothetical protein
MKLFLTKNRKNKYMQLKIDNDKLQQRIKEVNNKNNFFRNENSELKNKLKIAEQLLEEKDYKINHILELATKWSKN